MNQAELETLLLIEIQQAIANAAREAVSRLGQPVPPEARADYLSKADLETLKSVAPGDLHNPIFQRAMAASLARNRTLSYPPDGQITDNDADALQSLQLTDAQRSVLERVVSEACHAAFFHFLCLLDSVADPVLTPVKHWPGARFKYRRKEGSMLHDELGNAYYAFRKLSGG